MSKNIETLGEVQLSDNVWNVAEGITRISTDWPNMYVVVGDNSSALIDSGWGDEEEIDAIKGELARVERPLSSIVVTHKHPDHEGGVGDLQELFPGVPVIGLSKGFQNGWQQVDLGGRRLTVFGSPGHTDDSKYVFDSRTRALFTGDNILGNLKGDIEFMKDFMDGLGALVSLEPSVICPGHYESVFDATPAVQEVLRHRQGRENQVLESLRVGRGSTLDLLFDRIYGKEYQSKKGMAKFQIESHLIKLEGEGKVKKGKSGWRLPSPASKRIE